MPRYNLTALRLYIGALDCSVPSPVRYSQARTFSTIITTIQMKENIGNTSTSPKETRSVFVGAKVTPSQRDHIKSLAKQCGMTVSDYILSCAYNFKPKARLTKEEAALLQNLDNVILFIFSLLYINKIIITIPYKRNRIETKSII